MSQVKLKMRLNSSISHSNKEINNLEKAKKFCMDQGDFKRIAAINEAIEFMKTEREYAENQLKRWAE